MRDIYITKPKFVGLTYNDESEVWAEFVGSVSVDGDDWEEASIILDITNE